MGHLRADEAPPEADAHAVAALAREWLRGVTAAGFVPGVRAQAREALHELLRQAVAAARAGHFDPAPGYRIGAGLVALRMSAPQVLGTTVRLLAGRLPALAGGDQTVARARVLALVEQLAVGFAAAHRTAAVGAAEQMNRAEKLHWRTVQADLHQRLQHALLHETRTRLPNREHLRRRLAAVSGDGTARAGVCLLGIDGFEQLTDALGDDGGDLLLAAAADLLRPAAERGGHFLAHLGDGEFVLVVAGTTGADSMVKAACEARQRLHGLFPAAAPHLRITVTAGIVEGPAAGAHPDAWLRDAHLALGWARQDRHEHAVFEPGRAADDRRRQRLAAAMPAALDQGQFGLHFQPLYRLTDRTVIGVEALARWQRPGEPLLGPQVFISPAEQTGLIRPLGRSLLAQACRQGAAWRRAGHDLLISVNLSPLQLDDPGLVCAVADILRETGLPAPRLQLEITESAALDGHHEILNELSALDVRLAIDDFGTGYSSLATLSRLSVATVKLAGEFVAGLGADDATAATVVLRHVIEICHTLGIDVTAEGIETEDDERLLRRLGCDNGQGFLFARPAAAGAVTRLLPPGGTPPVSR